MGKERGGGELGLVRARCFAMPGGVEGGGWRGGRGESAGTLARRCVGGRRGQVLGGGWARSRRRVGSLRR